MSDDDDWDFAGADDAKMTIRAAIRYLLKGTTDGVRGDIVQEIISISPGCCRVAARAGKFFGRRFAWRIADGNFRRFDADLSDCAHKIASKGRVIFRNDRGQPALPFRDA